MNVTILDDTPDLGRVLLRRCWVAAKTCTSSKTPAELWARSGKLSDARMLKLIAGDVIPSGHWSVLRHASLTFAVDGISRACSHQFVRHHVGVDVEQQSQRAVESNLTVLNYIAPPVIEDNPQHAMVYDHALSTTNAAYAALAAAGVEAEDARMLLPNAAPTNLVVTMNLNSIVNFCAERLCTMAQEEIRILAREIREATVKVVPWMKEHLVIKCQRLGYCPEIRNADGHCSIRPPKHIFLEDAKRGAALRKQGANPASD